jgi:hypothetical protein
MPCPSQCLYGYFSFGGHPCDCCQARIQVSYHVSGGKAGGHTRLTLTNEKAWASINQVMGTPCSFKLSDEELARLLRLYRGMNLTKVMPDFSPDNPSGCCDQLVYELKIAYEDSQAHSGFETRYLSDDFVHKGGLPEPLRKLDAFLQKLLLASGCDGK